MPIALLSSNTPSGNTLFPSGILNPNATTEELFQEIHSHENSLSEEAYDAEVKRDILENPYLDNVMLMPPYQELIFIYNSRKASHEEGRILKELFKAISMPYYRKYVFEPLLQLAKKSGRKIAVIVGEVPGSKGSNQDIRNYGYMVTITGSISPNNSNNGFTLSSIGNEFSETLAEIYESTTYNQPSERHQGVSHTRPYQESTWAIDMTLEEYCKEIKGWEELTGNQRQEKILELIDDIPKNEILKKIEFYLDKVHQQSGYRKYQPLIGEEKARLATWLLNHINLKYAALADRIEFVPLPLRDSQGELVIDPETGEIVFTIKPRIKNSFVI
ncbi:MAG: hypothetical protein SFT81_00710 [Candidatus Caenarcaniphilales bacterium]|nr:hypothetical protein [Candidatus Caenarcaniphilales bacterium]